MRLLGVLVAGRDAGPRQCGHVVAAVAGGRAGVAGAGPGAGAGGAVAADRVMPVRAVMRERPAVRPAPGRPWRSRAARNVRCAMGPQEDNPQGSRAGFLHHPPLLSQRRLPWIAAPAMRGVNIHDDVTLSRSGPERAARGTICAKYGT